MYLLSFIFVNAIAQKTIVGKEVNFKKEILTTNLVGTLVMILTFIAFVIGLLGPHVCLFAYNRGCFGAETLLGVAVSFWIINASCYILNKETKSIWTGAFTAAILMTWFTIFATGMTFWRLLRTYDTDPALICLKSHKRQLIKLEAQSEISELFTSMEWFLLVMEFERFRLLLSEVYNMSKIINGNGDSGKHSSWLSKYWGLTSWKWC